VFGELLHLLWTGAEMMKKSGSPDTMFPVEMPPFLFQQNRSHCKWVCFEANLAHGFDTFVLLTGDFAV
jgi:hypothetical protein